MKKLPLNNPLKKIRNLLIALLFSATTAYAGLTDIATSPLVTSSTTAVLPNLMFVLDDSGSMDWDFLPDWSNDNYCKGTSGSFNRPCCRDSSDNGSSSSSCWSGTASFSRRGHPPFLNSDFNMVYYNPTITYTPPLNSDGSSKNSMTSANTSGWTSVKIDAYNIQNTNSIDLTNQYPDSKWCTASSCGGTCLRNDNYILPGSVGGNSYTNYCATTASGTGQTATDSFASPTVSATRSFGPHYYVIMPGEYCTASDLRTCTTATAPTGSYTIPAKVRWCNSTALTSCQAIKTPTYQYIRYPGIPSGTSTAAKYTFSVTALNPASSCVRLSSLKVGGTETLTGTTSSSTCNTINRVASRIKDNLSANGFSATVNNNVVTITTPVGTAYNSAAIVPTFSQNSATWTATQTQTGTTAGTVPGSFQRVDIVPGITSYPLPGTTAKASTRTDCVGTTCTYAEEMTNFANWWTYYHSRMQMMKSATSIAFAPIDNRYRVGFFTINTSSTATGTNFLNIGTFDATQKSSWYSKLFAADPSGGTPLRAALSKAGLIYAGGVGTDPVQYSCQQNFTILSTDGYWNGNAGYKTDGSTAVGNQDGSAARPMLDGNNTSDTLADVAYYYYMTDLRPSGAVSENNVPVTSKDNASYQHMTTFTLGLGITGYMEFSKDYETASSGDFYSIKNGSAAGGGVCSWQSSGACNWPAPSSDSQANIDDLWHAAVNGRGTYFAATNPSTLATGLSSALSGVSARSGSSAAATTSNPNVTSGDNFVFSSTFTTVEWSGQLDRQQLDLNTGVVQAAIDWSARNQLDSRVSAASDSRTIFTFSPSGTGKLKPFTWSDLTATEKDYFSSAKVATLSQALTGATLTSASGENLVNFIRGHRGNEGQLTDPSKYYRERAHILGDIVSAEAVYVKAPMHNYSDSGYAGFKSANTTRQGVVYAASNDGMLHAFNSDSGAEIWAYIPSLVMSNLYKLSDVNYATKHQYFVDGTPTVGDAYIGGNWKTILVGGLNAGGRGYYALDITDPTNPSALWEFTYDTSAGAGYTTDANLGYTFGNPLITKKSDGTWVVLVTSGYNNVSPGDGGGYLYVLNAATGAKISTISTGVGSSTTPSGLSRINAWVDNADTDETALRAYGGDLLGNLWRFDINNNVGATGFDAQQLANFTLSAAQPITTKPEVGECNGKPVVLVGTGRYMGASDMSDQGVQSFYAIKDKLDATSYGNVRSNSALVTQTLIDKGGTKRSTSDNAVDFSSNIGWKLDFDLPPAGERNNTDPTLALGTLVFTTNVPNSSACTVGGNSWHYQLDFCKGSFVSTATDQIAAQTLGNALATRPVVVRLPNNTVVSLTRLSDSTTVTSNINVGSSNTSTRRVSWRELISDQ